MAKKTQEEVIQDFINKHGNRYDYSKVQYTGTKVPVTIICPEHGEFQQTPQVHRRGAGCPECAKLKTKPKKSSEQLIQEFREVHKDKYDYSKVNYINNSTKIEIICPNHGSFFQEPKAHRLGQGCPKCSGSGWKRTQEDIIQEFKEIHGNKYDYSKVQYITGETPVTIICPNHGKFQQLPKLHKKGRGCPKCTNTGLNAKKSNEEIIQEFHKVHKDKYDYSKVNYINNNTKVEIICPKHGSFFQIPVTHKKGIGCPYCAGRMKNPQEEIIESFKTVHGNKYDYSKVQYKNTETPVTIICPDHGEFQQLPKLHKKGKGCPKCVNRNKTHEEIIEDFRKVHGDKYDYSKMKYEHSRKKIEIICPDHGSFWQRPALHKWGDGCPKCSFSKGEKKIMDYLEEHNIKYKPQYKIDDYPFRYDFYISSKNLLIEYDGIQHFEPVDFSGRGQEYAENSFKKTQEIDIQKTQLAKEKDYSLIRINYTDFENINEILDSIF